MTKPSTVQYQKYHYSISDVQYEISAKEAMVLKHSNKLTNVSSLQALMETWINLSCPL